MLSSDPSLSLPSGLKINNIQKYSTLKKVAVSSSETSEPYISH